MFLKNQNQDNKVVTFHFLIKNLCNNKKRRKIYLEGIVYYLNIVKKQNSKYSLLSFGFRKEKQWKKSA